MFNIRSSAKEHSRDQNGLGRYVDKFNQDEQNEMKSNYVDTSVARSSVKKSGFKRIFSIVS